MFEFTDREIYTLMITVIVILFCLGAIMSL